MDNCSKILVFFLILILIYACTSDEVEQPLTTPNTENIPYDDFPSLEEGANEFVLAGTFWEDTDLTYSFINTTNDLGIAEQKQIIEQAFQVWEDVSSLTFIEVDSNGDIEIAFRRGDHPEDNYPFDEGGEPNKNTLAHAFFPPPNGGSIAGDCHFDDFETWGQNHIGGQQIDLLTVAIHEIGHSLGLQHTSVEDAIMFASYGGNRRELNQDDIDGIQALYPPEDLPEWIVSFGANSSWNTMRESAIDIRHLLVGDFQGDGKNDIWVRTGGLWRYSNNATSHWISMRSSSVSSEHALVGDFNGDGEDDIWYGNGEKWRVSYSGTSEWDFTRESTVKAEHALVGDFNGDGEDDIWYGNGERWRISYSGTSEWDFTRESTVKAEHALIGDFNGDGEDDIWYGNGERWRVSYSGTSNWNFMRESTVTAEKALVGDFNGDNRCDIFAIL